jgi:hypothetical protein
MWTIDIALAVAASLLHLPIQERAAVATAPAAAA